MRSRYAIITPVKDEIKYFPFTISSVVDQEIKPVKWVIVDDGSTDGTKELIKELEAKHNWIEGIYLPPKGERKPGGEFVVNLALKHIDLSSLDFLVRMDGDLKFDDNYFSALFKSFDENPTLGIAGGFCYTFINDQLVKEDHPEFHTRGPLKTYRVECFKDIGGLVPVLGWDTIDEIKAHMKGYFTRSFHELKIVHYKPTQSANGSYKSRLNKGIAAYNTGYSPTFAIAKSASTVFNRPYFIGAFWFLWGYYKNFLKHEKKFVDDDFIKYIRKQQVNKLTGRETIWK